MLASCAGILALLASQLDARSPDALGVLALGLPPGPGPEVVESTLTLRHEIAARRAGVIDGDRLRARMIGPPSASLQELDRAFEASRAAYLGGDHEGSVRALRSILDDLDRVADGPETFRQWTRAALRLAKSETDLGRPDVARALLDRLVRAAPAVEVDPDVYPARFIQQVEQARAALRAEPTRTLRVTASVEGATVYLNGRDVGIAPVDLVVPRGRHRIAGALGAARVRPTQVDLQEGDQEAFLDFSVPEALRPALGPGLALPEDGRAGRIIASGAYLGLAEIAVVQRRADGDASFVLGALYDVRRGMLVREGRVRAGVAGGVRALAEFLVTGTVGAGVELLDDRGRPMVAVASGPQRPEPSPQPQRTLGWLSLGTGIAALGLAAYAGTQTWSAASSYSDARRIRAGGITTYERFIQYNGAVTRGDSANGRAALGWVGAGACAAGAAVAGYVNYRRTGEFGPFRF